MWSMRPTRRQMQPQGPAQKTEKKPTRFTGAVMISPERPARDIHQIVEAIVEQLTTLSQRFAHEPGCTLADMLRLERQRYEAAGGDAAWKERA